VDTVRAAMKCLAAGLLAASGAAYAAVHLAAATGACESLAGLKLTNVTITGAESVGAGAFVPPGGAAVAPFRNLPAFCRVAATLALSVDSTTATETWMPATGWSGKFEGVGNGAFNGSVEYAAMATALARGYATASTDTGHAGNNGRFALGHPEKVIDFAWRAVHEMTVASRKITDAYYGSAPKFSYWNGCSAGGRQGLKEAQRFPDDYNGIVAGAPALDWTGRASQAVRMSAIFENEQARLSPAQQQMIHAAALASCDLDDGLKDGIISAPDRCTFDPGTLECGVSSSAQCLTRPQAAAVRAIYTPLVNASTKRVIAPLYPGSELGWTDRGWTASARATGLDEFRFIVFKDPAWTVARFDAGNDPARAEEDDRDTINAFDPDLKPFLSRGGKLLQFHGWSDAQISPGNSTQYYTRVLDTVRNGAQVGAGYRMFIAPGMAHCRGGEGPSAFDAMDALEAWVEHGQPPDRIIASHSTNGVVDRTRPLCPYPQTAVYSGSGDIDAAANFACRLR